MQQIRVKGQINRNWHDWMGGLAIVHTEQGETVLTGPVRDQSALYRLLTRLSDLGLQLNSVTSTQNGKERQNRKFVSGIRRAGGILPRLFC